MKINPNDQFPLFAEEFGQSATSINYFLRRFLGDSIASIPGGSVIDVGSGDGLLSFYSALLGARQVTSIEPETAGSTGGILKTYELHRKSLGYANCELVETDFLKLPADRKYDVLLSNASVNHIREVDGDIRTNPTARESQREVIRHMAGNLRPNGWLVLADCSRRNVFGDFGLRSPFQRSINWKIHQTPSAWRTLLQEEGISNFQMSHYVPYKARWFAKIVGSQLGSYLTYSWFVLRGQRVH